MEPWTGPWTICKIVVGLHLDVRVLEEILVACGGGKAIDEGSRAVEGAREVVVSLGRAVVWLLLGVSINDLCFRQHCAGFKLNARISGQVG